MTATPAHPFVASVYDRAGNAIEDALIEIQDFHSPHDPPTVWMDHEQTEEVVDLSTLLTNDNGLLICWLPAGLYRWRSVLGALVSEWEYFELYDNIVGIRPGDTVIGPTDNDAALSFQDGGLGDIIYFNDSDGYAVGKVAIGYPEVGSNLNVNGARILHLLANTLVMQDSFVVGDMAGDKGVSLGYAESGNVVEVVVAGTAKFIIDTNGSVFVRDLPTSDPSSLGQLWDDNGTIKISSG